MGKHAIVLSGGGFKGAWQLGAIKALRDDGRINENDDLMFVGRPQYSSGGH